MPLMQVTVLFFAMLRDIVGADSRQLQLDAEATPAMIWSDLVREFPTLQAFERPPMIAVNESYAAASTTLRENDVVAFIPPVSGG